MKRSDLNRQRSVARQTATAKLGRLWCKFMHHSLMWPIHGQYRCRSCGRCYSVPWTEGRFLLSSGELTSAKPAAVRQARIPSLRSAILPAVVTLAVPLAPPIQRANPTIPGHEQKAIAFSHGMATPNKTAVGILNPSKRLGGPWPLL
jgi:hypothetical protein